MFVYENGRRYRKGFAPSDLLRPIDAVCSRCGGLLIIYPAGAACRDCSPPDLGKVFARDLDRRRVRIGAMPASEL